MRHWLWLMLSVPVSALTLMVGWQEVEDSIPLITRGSALAEVEEDPRETADAGSPGKTAVKRT